MSLAARRKKAPPQPVSAKSINDDMLSLLGGKDVERQKLVARLLGSSARFASLNSGGSALTFTELAAVLKGLSDAGYAVDPEDGNSGLEAHIETPLTINAFYAALMNDPAFVSNLRDQIAEMIRKGRARRGVVTGEYNAAATPALAEAVTRDLAAFEQFCRDNKISFDETECKLTGRKTVLEIVNNNKFLLAAILGAGAGAAGNRYGVNVAQITPELGKVPGIFFSALPFFAVPFIGLNTYKAFSGQNILGMLPLLGRFTATMALGIAIGFTAIAINGGNLGTLAVGEQAAETLKTLSTPGTIEQAMDYAMKMMGQYSPGAWLMPVIYSALGLVTAQQISGFIKRKTGAPAKYAAAEPFRAAANGISSAITGTFNALQKITNPLTDMVDKSFMKFISYAGPPAIFLLICDTLSQGGFEKFSDYSGYYATVGLALGMCTAAVMGAAYLYGCRAKEFMHIAKTYTTAFSLSSSSATMPTTKKSLRAMKVPAHIVNSVVPLGATFNMMGTALYLGMTAVCAAQMLGMDPTWGQKAGIMGAAIMTAFGAPGIPASSVAFMTPVLATLGLTQEQTAALFAMILIMDRPFDMLQTSLNVTGDMTVALDTRAQEKREGIYKYLNYFGKKTAGAPVPAVA